MIGNSQRTTGIILGIFMAHGKGRTFAALPERRYESVAVNNRFTDDQDIAIGQALKFTGNMVEIMFVAAVLQVTVGFLGKDTEMTIENIA